MSEVVNSNATETMHRFEDLPIGQYFWYGCNTRYKLLWCKIADDGRSILCYAGNSCMRVTFDVPREDGSNRFERSHGYLIYPRTVLHRWLNGNPLTDYERNNWPNYRISMNWPNSFKQSFLGVFSDEERNALQTMHLELETPNGYLRRYGRTVAFDAKVVVPDVRELVENTEIILGNQETTVSVEPCDYAVYGRIADDCSYNHSNIFSDGSMMNLVFRNANQSGYTRTIARQNNRVFLSTPLKPDKPFNINPIIKIAPDMEFADITETYSNYCYPQALEKIRTQTGESGQIVRERNTVMIPASFVQKFHEASNYIDSLFA